MTATPREAVDAANQAFGRHPGRRALHAKGTLLKGTFTATPEGARLTRAAHLQGDAVPATVRVSNGSGNPRQPDSAPDVRGLAVKLYLPGGARTDIVCQTSPRFPVSTPDAFVELLRAQRPGPAMAWRLPRFLARHPRALVNLQQGLPALRPIASYATCTYYGLHAFRWLGADGDARYVRYTLVPEAGDQRLSLRQARARGPDYLQEDIRERVSREPLRFTLALQLAGSDDNIDDPSVSWPRDRERVRAATLELTGLEEGREKDGDVLVFDPTRVTDGIELSDDPVLRFRPRAYDESVSRRTA